MAGLALDRAPPLGVPLRFLLTAPAFGAAAGLALAWLGPHAVGERLAAGPVAAVHLYTLGTLTMVMCGALLQLLPVVGGAAVPAQRWVARLVHATLLVGVPLLAAGLAGSGRLAVGIGVGLVAGGLTVLAAAAAIGIARGARGQATVRAVSLALAALLVTVALGATAALGRVGWPVPPYPWGAFHQGWALLGWVGLLVMGVGWQVVPMFQMTPAYPAKAERWLPWTALLGLVTWAGLVAAGVPGPAVAGLGISGAALAAFAVLTLYLQARRQRRLPDATLDAWRLAMASLLGAVATGAFAALAPGAGPAWSWLAGVLYLTGFAGSAVAGMLYKIVPFLLWLHLHRVLQPVPGALGAVPHMRQLLPEVAARRHLRLHLAALVLAAAASVWPEGFTGAAGVALAVAWGYLGIVLARAVARYRTARRMLAAREPAGN